MKHEQQSYHRYPQHEHHHLGKENNPTIRSLLRAYQHIHTHLGLETVEGEEGHTSGHATLRHHAQNFRRCCITVYNNVENAVAGRHLGRNRELALTGNLWRMSLLLGQIRLNIVIFNEQRQQMNH
jgi:ribosomal protein L6P/L9E